MCGPLEVSCQVKEGFQAVAANVLDQLRQETTHAALNTLQSASFWIRPDTPHLAEQNGNTWTNNPAIEFMHSGLLPVTIGVFTVAVIIAGIRIAWEQRAQPAQELLKAMLTFVVVAGAGTATMQLLAEWSDAFAVSIIDKAAKDLSLAAAFGGPVSADGKVTDLVADTMPNLLAMAIGVSVIIASLVQLVLMLVRSAMLVLLAGAFPLAAAATNTDIGRTWLKKFCGWSLAFIAYKPAAALVYAAAIMMSKSSPGSTDAVMQAMTGMMMLLLSIFALPALLRFMVPLTTAAAGGNAAMGTAATDPGGLATGALNIATSRLSTASPGTPTPSSPSGASLTNPPHSTGATGASGASGAAGLALAAARKAAGGVAGAAAHSAGEPAGGIPTPPTAGPLTHPRRHRTTR
ncbi:hypothetical protein [Kribbella solani]|uniref:TrbL/VirB6 plasmid conjugal transfer protein n=1 Tax=Kribbella solani TaxID=236067 RepID=A0A841DUP1_9ACTN|nr:hypothetical protein [Kribbella solani]MBB5981809.1 hypothetical protein [Kribbella solani]